MPALHNGDFFTTGAIRHGSTMHAAQVTKFGEPLEIREIPIPKVGLGQILVKTEACGVCHTDLHAQQGDWPLKPSPPFTPGHEGIGKVVEVGEGVTEVKEGDRVGVPWLYSTCGHCEYCLGARETVCADAVYGGYTADGGFAEYMVADPKYVAKIPDGLDPIAAAPIVCAGITTYKGVKETGVRPGQWLVVSGTGGLGHLAIQYAKAMGLHVAAVDIDDGKLRDARGYGAEVTVNAKTDPDPVATLKEVTGGGAHGVVITAPSKIAFEQGIAMTRKRGTCVLIGLPPIDVPLPLFSTVCNEITVKGSFVGTRMDMQEALQFAAEGKVKANIEVQPLSQVNDVLDRLHKGKVQARVVLDFKEYQQ